MDDSFTYRERKAQRWWKRASCFSSHFCLAFMIKKEVIQQSWNTHSKAETPFPLRTSDREGMREDACTFGELGA